MPTSFVGYMVLPLGSIYRLQSVQNHNPRLVTSNALGLNALSVQRQNYNLKK